MRRDVKNCRDLNMQTIRLRRSRPSSLSIAVALAITMLIVWLVSLQSCPKEEAKSASAAMSASEIRMEAMEARFLLSGVHDDKTQANVSAALCAENGGAGLVLRDGERFAVAQAANDDSSGSESPVIQRSCRGLTLKIEAPAAVIGAISDGLSAMRALAEETRDLASSLERGETDGRTIAALLNVYRTQLSRAMDEIKNHPFPALALIERALENSIARTDAAIAETTPGKLRLMHAAGCMEWISLSGNLIKLG